MGLDLTADAVQLTEDLVNIESVSGDEALIADAIEDALVDLPHLTVRRFGHTIVARTELGRDERVVIAGHIDTVPLNDNLPARRDPDGDGNLHGLGACDMKGGVAVALRTAATMPAPNRDVTYLFYECEEVEAERNGLQVLSQTDPELLQADYWLAAADPYRFAMLSFTSTYVMYEKDMLDLFDAIVQTTRWKVPQPEAVPG